MLALPLQTPEHCHQQIYRQNPDQDDLPEPQITGAVMIACDIRVARKKFFSIFENVNPGKDNSDEADTEKMRSGKPDSTCERITAKSVLTDG